MPKYIYTEYKFFMIIVSFYLNRYVTVSDLVASGGFLCQSALIDLAQAKNF